MATAIDSAKWLVDRHDAPVVVLGHSRGGQVARVVADRHPELVAGVITLATPGTRAGLSRALLAAANGFAILRAAGLTGFASRDCVAGAGCCGEFTSSLKKSTSLRPMRVVWSPRDDIVPGSARLRATDPREERMVNASHLGMLANAEVLVEIADALLAFSAS